MKLVVYNPLVFTKLSKASDRTLIKILLLIGFIVYFNSLFNGFVWDDEEQIVNNTVIHSISNISMIFRSGTFNSGGAGLSGWFYRPVVTLYYMLIYSFFGPTPWVYHFIQVLLHLTNAALVFILFRKVLDTNNDSKNNKLLAFLGTLFFAVHPINVESVSYIASIGDILYTFFGLSLTLLIIASETLSYRKTFAISLLLILALLSKESALALIPISLLASTISQHTKSKSKVYNFLMDKPKFIKIFVSSSIVILSYLFIRIKWVGINPSQPMFSPISEATLFQRLITIPSILISYLSLLLLPINLSVSRHWVVKSASDPMFFLYLTALIIVCITFWKILKKQMTYTHLFFLTWIFSSMFIILNIFPLDMTIAERWMYFPSTGLIGLGLLLVNKCISSIHIHNESVSKLLPVATIIYLIFIGFRTFVRNTNWRNGYTLYTHDIRISGESYDLQNNVGVELFRKGQKEEAKVHFEKSIELQPKWWFAYNNLGAYYQNIGNLGGAKKYYSESLKRSDYYLAYENLAWVMLKTDSLSDTEEFLENALRKLPNNPNLALSMAIIKYKLEKYEEALKFAQWSYQLSPNTKSSYVLEKVTKREILQLD